MSEPIEQLKQLKGLLATVVIRGSVEPMYADCLRELARYNDRIGLVAIEYVQYPSTLVEQGRDEAVKHALACGYDYLLQVDADMTFAPHSLAQLLHRAFIEFPDAEVVGAYCQLGSSPYLPTIDSGTGTWEPWWPGSGVVDVIRTGAAFLLTKTTVFRRFGPPWFRAKWANRPLDAMWNVDNFARCKLSGRNPWEDTPEWETLTQLAKENWGTQEHGIGEDSGFCDRVKASGGRILVDSDCVIGHVRSKEIITWQHLKRAMDDQDRLRRLACGILD